jgi:cellulose synthase (UDP-forming)
MSLHSALVWLAAELQVSAPERGSAWLIRLLLLPPREQSALVIDPQRVPDPRQWAAGLLGVTPEAPWYIWLWRLLVVPPNQRFSILQMAGGALRALARTLLSVLAGISKLLYLALIAALWPVRIAISLLDALAMRVRLGDAGEKAERVLTPLLAAPGLRWVLLGLCGVLGAIVLTTPFSALGQLCFLLVCWAVSMVLRRQPGRYPSIMLMSISLITMGRYLWWRVTTTLEFDSVIEAVLGMGLLAAEAYTWLVVVMGFIQTAWPLERQSTPLTQDITNWPTVDVFIPTYNEPMSVVRPTLLAALAMDWPRDKLRIHLLDDGRREAFRELAQSLHIQYLVRPDNKHAKAGNLNHALKQTDGDLVAIFDCDHIPAKSFLKTCVGWFQRDPKCAMLQTPHHFFSPDPFERNLGTFRRVPNEGSLFYGLIQDGNDFWNATFFCGSCAVIRRKPLMEVGGIAVETVTEDAHTALRLHRLGYTTAYINQTVAAGLATESLSAHVGQRIRWARGMAQIFRLDNPFLGKGLTVWQRICYGNAMLHFFFGLPRLVFLTAPMTFLFFEWHVINASAVLLALFVLPYIIQSNIANAHVQGKHRHTFWAEVYETVLATYVALPTTVALFNPRAGTFNVTAKGGLVSRSFFDWGISTPYTALVVLNFAAFGMGLMRLFFWNTHEVATVLLNLVWTLYSILILGAALGVASEARQVRRTHRVDTRLPAVLYLDNGQAVHCECLDYSLTGLGLRTAPGAPVSAGDHVSVSLWHGNMECAFLALVVLNKDGLMGVQFEAMTRQQEIDLVQCTFARPDAWVNWNETHDQDKPLQGLQEIGRLGLQGYGKLWQTILDHIKDMARHRAAMRAKHT